MTPDPSGAARPAGASASGAAKGNGSGNGNGNGNGKANGHEPATTVAVASSIESALAAVQQQLAREAATVQLVPVAVPAAPEPAPVAAPVPVREVAPPPPPAPTSVAPVVVAPMVRDDAGYESEFWGEPRPRRQAQRQLDLTTLTAEERKALGKLRARKVRRIIRHVSPWSVFKFSIFFYLCMWLILMVAGVILWKVSDTAGVIANVEKFYAKAAGEKSFEIDGRGVFRAAASAGVILVFAMTGFTVLISVLFNLITDLTGGIRLSVIELETARRVVRRRRPGSEQVLSKAEVTDEELESAEAASRPTGSPGSGGPPDPSELAGASGSSGSSGGAPPTVPELVPSSS